MRYTFVQLRWSIWLLIVATICTTFTPTASAVSCPLKFPVHRITISGCDGQNQPNLAYDVGVLAGSGYDSAAVFSTGEEVNPTATVNSLYGHFTEVLAAEETAESTALVPYYPPNAGFAGASGEASLVPGAIVDRYGGAGGSFLSPQGTPAWARLLPFGAENNTLNAYEVVQPINVNAGTAASWFNQLGGGLQFDLGTSTHINSGHLRPLQ